MDVSYSPVLSLTNTLHIMNFLAKHGLKIAQGAVTATAGGVAGYAYCIDEKFGSQRNMKQHEKFKAEFGEYLADYEIKRLKALHDNFDRYDMETLNGDPSFIKYAINNRNKIKSLNKLFNDSRLQYFVNGLCDDKKFYKTDLRVLNFMNNVKKFLFDGGKFDIYKHEGLGGCHTDYKFRNEGESTSYIVRVCDSSVGVYEGSNQIMIIRNGAKGLKTQIGSKTSFIPKNSSQTQNGDNIFPIDNNGSNSNGSIETDETGVDFISQLGSYMGLSIEPEPEPESEPESNPVSEPAVDLSHTMYVDINGNKVQQPEIKTKTTYVSADMIGDAALIAGFGCAGYWLLRTIKT